MWVLLIYVVLMIAGDLINVGIGAVASNMWGDPVSLPLSSRATSPRWLSPGWPRCRSWNG